jgi:hypothetical protein
MVMRCRLVQAASYQDWASAFGAATAARQTATAMNRAQRGCRPAETCLCARGRAAMSSATPPQASPPKGFRQAFPHRGRFRWTRHPSGMVPSTIGLTAAAPGLKQTGHRRGTGKSCPPSHRPSVVFRAPFVALVTFFCYSGPWPEMPPPSDSNPRGQTEIYLVFRRISGIAERRECYRNRRESPRNRGQARSLKRSRPRTRRKRSSTAWKSPLRSNPESSSL